MVKQKREKLKPGDTLGVCAPSGSFDPELFEQGLGVMRSMGFQVHVPRNLGRRKRYLAGSDSHRARMLEALFLDENIHGIICARGGFGAMRTLPHIDYELVKNNTKPFVGFSDASALLSVLEERCFCPVFHGPVVTSLARASRRTADSLFSALTGCVEAFPVKRGRSLLPGSAAGIVSGGNLATLCHLTGTAFQPDFKNKIVFLEDVGEAPYKIDRMLCHMKMAGVFSGVKGVVAGSFEGCGSFEMIDDILSEVFEDLDVPLLAGLDAGHGEHNLCLPLGGRAELNADSHALRFV
ncbi:MAG: LD-carboxypeptidase [Desulfobacteraceae bacterium]